LGRNHKLTDYFFSLPPLQPAERLDRMVALSRTAVVEVETHPVNEAEYQFLMGEGVLRWIADVPISKGFRVASHN
jgi:hypothetical protein